ncbi:MAG: YcnI family protein [Burkholderiaceae bacterium]|nr:YcnI family protein [Burkholderiaceae bacterium]
MKPLKTLATLVALFGITASHAHVVLEEPAALAGSSYRASFRIGHGCAGSPTTGIRVFIPAGVRGAKPMPKAGWTLSTQRAPLAQPYDNHGKTVREDVVEVSWTVQNPAHALPDDWYEEFVLRATLPAQAGALWFRVLQTCASGQLDWADIPAQGTSTRGMKTPAALLDVLPSGGAAGHAH